MQSVSNIRRNSVSMQDAVLSVLVSPAKSTGIFSYAGKKLGGKAAWLVLLIVLGLSLSYSPNAKGQETCLPPSLGCTWTDWEYMYPQMAGADVCITVNIGGNNCQVCYSYMYRSCGTMYEVYVNWFKLDDPCRTYMTNLLNTSSAADSAEYIALNKSITEQGKLVCVKDYFKRIIRNGNTDYDCVDPTGCLSTKLTTTIRAYSTQCVEYIDVSGSDGSCLGITWILDCSSTYCCIKSWEVCYDASSGQVRTCNPSTYSTGLTPTCEGSAPFTLPPGCSILHRTGCIAIDCP